ncbi:putative dipeptidase [Lunatimonas lonarensis]|uniref:Putative dipeptidase n=1 Tax=Lunatimonas lonarensis TaxID=1232681 RepID=R7ZZK5_9BACT|nr:dipeptidase [Lunatimonas lonarensis]EON79488.1 putative dipeptidase [Lunatimonas lonarensis]
MKEHIFFGLLLISLLGCKSDRSTEKMVHRVLQEAPLIDGHNDLLIHYIWCGECPRELDAYPLDTATSGHIDLPRLRKGGVGALLTNIFGRGRQMNEYLQGWDLIYRLAEKYPEDLQLTTSSKEVRQAMKEGRIGIIPSMEHTYHLVDDLGRLRTLYHLGLRSVILAYDTNNIADGAYDKPVHDGLSAYGKEMVLEMNRLGIIIDLSHITEKGMLDALEITTAPVIFSHANARALTDTQRNVSDKVLLKLKENGGVIMLTPVNYFTTQEAYDYFFVKMDSVRKVFDERYPDPDQMTDEEIERADEEWMAWESANPLPVVTVKDFADHFDYVKNLIGVDHIGIGSDFDGMTYLIEGMEDASAFPHILSELANRGWTESELKKVTQQNFLRVFEAVEQRAEELKRSTNPRTAKVPTQDVD